MRRGIQLLISTGVVVAIVVATTAQRGLAQEETRDRAKAGVAMLQARNDNGTSAGAAIIVATSSQEVYAVTAYHLLRGATSVQAQFQTRPGEWFNARVLDLRDPDLDLGAIAVTLPPQVNVGSLRGVGASSAALLIRGSDVFPLGFPAGRAWSMPVAPDKVASTTRNRVIFQSNFTRAGNSGGALLDTCGRVTGMVVIDDPPEAEAIRIDAILDVVRNWSLPGTLQLTAASTQCGAPLDNPPPPPTTCDVSLSSTPTGADIYLDDRRVGVTPRTVSLRRNEPSELRVEKEGFKPFEQQIDCSRPALRATLESSTTNVTLSYGGDPYGCVLQIQVKIGDRTAAPQGNSFVMTRVPVGRQQYSISGSIACAAIGQCAVQGRGTVNVEEDSTFNVVWRNTAFAQCSVSLTEQ